MAETKSKEQEPLLELRNLVAGYGNKPIVNGISVSVGAGEIVAIIGHNGAGKSTLLKVAFGLLPIWSGEVVITGHILRTMSPRQMLEIGVAYVPQGDRVFDDMTVRENLFLSTLSPALSSNSSSATFSPFAKRGMREKDALGLVEALFPDLSSRLSQRAGTLSGGEKQMLALSSALVRRPRLLLLDEPSLGLAPPLVAQALQRIQYLNREQGLTIFIVEQKVREVLKIAQRVYVLRNGQVIFRGCAEDLQEEAKLREVYL